MVELRKVETGPGLVFDASVAGDAAAPLVLLLHGFAVSRHLYDAQLPALAEAGYFAVAPDQRGYSPGARPNPAQFAQYDIELLIADALDLVVAVRHGAPRRFLGSLTMLSRPHPDAFGRALRDDPEQPHRSRHHKAFLDPGAVARLLAEDAKWLRERHAANGVPPGATAKHLSVLGDPRAMEAALAWYRARGTVHRPIGPVKVPTLFVWGDADDTVGRVAAEGTRDFVQAPYRFEALPGVGHYAPDQVPERVTALLLDHLAAHRL